MFLAGVEKAIPENSSIGMFADDIVLWHSNHDIPSIEANLSQCLSRVSDFVTNHKLSFKLTKRDWGADASTLKLTYTTLTKTVLEFGSANFFSASDSNLKKFERIQLSAARIIAGLRNSCPNNLVLYECNHQPLDMRRNYC
ncbi:putative RNA-directed DNA polymerase from transposon BS [Trichonephila clavipes]|nr:putative RNA-directed DNA polymerase from transposon BS [Trichonephila clavipes]